MIGCIFYLLSFISLLHCLHPYINPCWHRPPLVHNKMHNITLQHSISNIINYVLHCFLIIYVSCTNAISIVCTSTSTFLLQRSRAPGTGLCDAAIQAVSRSLSGLRFLRRWSRTEWPLLQFQLRHSARKCWTPCRCKYKFSFFCV